MRSTRVQALSVLAAVVVVTAGMWSGSSGLAPLSQAAAAERAGTGPVDLLSEFDRMGGSGTAGIDPAEAAATTAAEAASLTGDIVFSVPSGSFRGQLSVTLSTTIADAQIRYTTDGTAPGAGSTLYQGSQLTFSTTTQLRAQAFVAGAASGAMGTALYLARAIDATHDLPLVVMDAYGRGKPGRDTYLDVATMVVAPQNGTTSLAQTPTIATRAGFHLRGQSSANFEKAPYRVELWDNEGKDADYPVLGMPADSDWVLRGPFPDKTLVRDAFTYGIGREMGMQVPRYALVELYLNLDSQPMAANDYQGVYMFVENIKRSADRLNIQKLKKTDLTEPAISGGYIMQINMMAAEPPTLTCTVKPPANVCWSDLELNEPDEVQPEQQAWITNYMQKFHDALHSTDPANPQTGYPAYIDVDSFVNQVVLNELSRQPDSYIRSQHFYKDRDAKLFAGPLWDYDLAYAAFTGFGAAGVQGWQYQPAFGMAGTDWFVKLMQDATFVAKVKARWQTLRLGLLSDAQLSARLTALTTPLTNAAQRNFQRWPNLNTSMVGGFSTQVTQTWAEQVQIMRTFLTQRAAWLNLTTSWGGNGGTPSSPSQSSPSQPPSSSASSPSSPPPGGRTCTASYAVTSQWNTGFQSEVKVTAGSAAITGWRVTWTFANGQTISQSWNATVTASGANVTATNVSYNGALAAGAATAFGFIGTWSGSNNAPALACTAS